MINSGTLTTEEVGNLYQKAKEIDEPKFTHEELRDALIFAEDVLERADMPFFVWGKTLEHIMNHEERLDGDTEITLAIKRSEVVDHHVSILDIWSHGITKEAHRILFKCGKVPIVVNIIEGRYPFLEHPETVYYWIGNFQIPNPYEAYLKVKDEIK